jgi:CRISPR/Cas system-associated protein Cas10 (large subunit of type III CRISPR-Cas system)
MKYLYGLGIQGIQSYIFNTSKLKEIVGASELVDSLPRDVVSALLGTPIDSSNVLMDAAGNFKYILDEDDCKKLFEQVPKRINELAGNITVSQAVVRLNSDQPTKANLDELEKKLRAQRNRHIESEGVGIMSLQKVSKTGNVQIDMDKGDGLDTSNKLKRKKIDASGQRLLAILGEIPKSVQVTNNIEKITSDDYENWLAVVHADGNGLGTKIIQLSQELGNNTKEAFKNLSVRLQEATEAAVQKAFQEVVVKKIEEEDLVYLPFRPIIIGGDDVTVIVRGDIAFEFTESFLRAFEVETTAKFQDFDQKYWNKDEVLFANGLTACAGIAFIKSHYPFHYGVKLAEDMTKAAKKVSKGINKDTAPSSLLFHKMHSSFVRKWDDIVENELKVRDVLFLYGPYFIDDSLGCATTKQMKEWVKEMKRDTAPKSNVRQWLSELGTDKIRALDLGKRTHQMIKQKSLWKKLKLDDMENFNLKKTHLYDVLQLVDITTKTNQNGNNDNL